MASVTYSHKLNESKYNNWVKAGLAVLFTKEGIQPFVNDEIEQFQQKCLTDICKNNGLPVGTTCSSCCTENVVVCPTNRICNVGRGNCSFHRNSSTLYHPSGCTNKICHNFKTEIQNAHRYYGPSYRNTDATQWCRNSWEVAKCFMPPDGYKDVASATETDFNGIISVIMNYKGFKSKVHDINLFDKGRDIGKAVRHSPTFEVKDTDLQLYFTDLQNLLSDPGYLATNADAQNAKQKLSQLQNDTLIIGKDDVEKVLDDVTKAIQDRIRTEGEVAVTKIKKDLEIVKMEINSGVETISSQSENAVKLIQVGTDEGVKKLETEADAGVKTIVKTIVSETANAVKQIQVGTGEGVKKVATEASAGVKTIASETDNAVKQIEVGTNEGVKKVETEADVGLKTIVSETCNAVQQVQVGTDEGVNKVATEASAGVKTIASETAKTVKQIEVGTNEGVKKVELEADSGVKAIALETDNAVQQIKVSADESVKKVEFAADVRLKMIESKAVEALSKAGNEQSEDVKYNNLKKDLKSDLTTYYKEICGTIPICPCLDEVDAPFIKVYIPPYPLYSQETDKLNQLSKQGKGQKKQGKISNREYHAPKTEPPQNETPRQETETSERIPVNSLHKIFNKVSELGFTTNRHKESKEFKNIYLTAEPGLGKTSFVKWLALNWCQAHSPVKNECCYFDQNDVNQMKTFEFLFVIFLRETDATESHVDSLITNNVISALARQSAYTPEILEKVMFNEKCLIRLDGLDEWAMSGIPKRSTRKACTYLTTSRPWRFCVLPLDSTKIDQHVCIEKVEQVCSKKLIRRILSIFEERECLRDDALNADNACQIFKSMLDEKKITQFYNTPVILVQLLYLWNISKEIGNSQSEIYGDIVDALFSIAEKKVQLLDKFKYHRPSNVTYFKSFFFEDYYDLMIKLGKLAFETLFSENKGSSLVFDEAVAFKYLPADENATTDVVLSTCLQTGLLTKQFVYVRARRKQYTYSFYHKTVQEFLAALYIQSEYSDYIGDVIKKRCSSVSCILEMETVFMFLSSFHPSIASVILQSLQSTINEDETTGMYRCKYLPRFNKEHRQMKSIQNMLVSCETEITTTGHGCRYLPLIDIIIDDSCKEESYSASLKNLLKSNANKIQSLVVSSRLLFTPDVINYFRKHFELSEVWSVCKLQIDESSISNDLHDLIGRFAKSLKCLAVSIDSKTAFVPGMVDHFLGLKTQKLESLCLFSHENVHDSILEQLIHFISHQTILKEICLAIEFSVNRYTTCNVPQLNLCQHEHLQTLSLHNVPLKHLQLNDYLQKLTLENVPLTHLQLNDHLRELTLDNIPLTNLQLKDNLKQLTLDNVPLTELQLGDNLKVLRLTEVPLTHLQLNDHFKQLTLHDKPITDLQLHGHLQELTLQDVPLIQFQMIDHLRKLTLLNVPLTQLQLNDTLKDLTLMTVPLTMLQLNDCLQTLHLHEVPLSQLQLTHNLQEINLSDVPIKQLELGDNLKRLTLTNVPLTQLQLNDHLKELSLGDIPLAQLQLNDHLKELRLEDIPLTQLQLNVHLKVLMLNDISLAQLQLNDSLTEVSLYHVPLTQLQLGGHLQELSLMNIPLAQLQLNDNLTNVWLHDVPLTQLQLCDNLQELSLMNIPLARLHLNDHIKKLILEKIPVTILQLNDSLKYVSLNEVPLTQLQLGDHLQALSLEKVPLTQLQLNDHLKKLGLDEVPLTQLQLGDNLQELILNKITVTKLELRDNLMRLTLNVVQLTQLHLNERLQELTLEKVPLTHLQLNDYLQELTLDDVPLTHLQLNDHLKQVTLHAVPITQLQLDDHLQWLTLKKIPLTHLQLNETLEHLTLKKVPLTKLQLNDHLQELTLANVPLAHLQLNETLKDLILKKVPLNQLQLNDNLQTLLLYNVPLTQLRLNDHLKELTLDDVPLKHLRLGNRLRKLTLVDVPLTQLQLNDHLQQLTLKKIPITYLFLIDHLKHLTLNGVPLAQVQLNDHLELVSLHEVPLTQLQLGDHVKKLTLKDVPLTLLQLNDKLKDLTLENAPLPYLQLGNHLQKLAMKKVVLPNLQLNDHLNELTLEEVTLTHLQLGDHLQMLTLKKLSLTHLQSNDHLQTLTLKNIPTMHLQLDDHISHIRNMHLISISLSNSTCNILLDKLMNCESLKMEDITLKDTNTTEHQDTERIDILHVKGQHFTSNRKSFELQSFNMNSKVLKKLVDTLIKSEHSATVSLSNVTVEDVTSTEQQEIVNQDNTLVLALSGHSFTHGKKEFKFNDVIISNRTFKRFVDTVQECRYPVVVELCSWYGGVSLYYRKGIEYVRSLSSFTIVVDGKDCFSFEKINLNIHGNIS